MKKILYISYDGMTDPLGRSQVINYLIGLRSFGYEFDILSFEKKDKFAQSGEEISSLLTENKIGWYPQIFHTKPPVISKIIDRRKLFSMAAKLHAANKYDLIHCRSYTAAEAGLKLKLKTGVKFLFDMRGFWADEKADGGHWNQANFFWRNVYKFYKTKEKEFITGADHIISLTRAGKKDIEGRIFYNDVPITVIPCCADTERFLISTAQKKETARKLLSIPDSAFVLSYLGSLGTWYMIDEMLMFFKKLKDSNSRAFFLIISNSDFKIITEKLSLHGLAKEDVKIINVPFTEVPQNMYASDVSISFIKPVYSKISSSPVKIGEILSMGIPLVANNIGDSGLFVQENGLGEMIEEMTEESMDTAIARMSQIKNIDPAYIREIAMQEYSLTKGVQLYKEVYNITI